MWKKFLIPYYINSFWAELWLGRPVASQNLFFMGGRLPKKYFFFWWNSLKVGMSIFNNILKVTPQWAIWPMSSQTFSEISYMLLHIFFGRQLIWKIIWRHLLIMNRIGSKMRDGTFFGSLEKSPIDIFFCFVKLHF